MSASTVALIGALFHRFEMLRPLLEEHLKDQDGEVLPHLLMADVERWAEAEIAKGGDDARALVQSILDFLEAAYTTQGGEVEDLIAVSFLEHLPRPGEPGSQLRTMLGPRLAEQLQRIG